MSIYHISQAKDGSGNAYVVVPPCASDVLSTTLRDAYHMPVGETDPFADLLRELDRIEIPQRGN